MKKVLLTLAILQVVSLAPSHVMGRENIVANAEAIVSMEQIQKMVQAHINKLSKEFLDISDYPVQTVNLEKNSDKVTIHLSKNKSAKGNVPPFFKLILDKKSGQLLHISFVNPFETQPKLVISDEDAKKRSLQMLQTIAGKEAAAQYQMLSIWREEGTPEINYKSPIVNSIKEAKYASIKFGENGSIISVSIEVKPVTFDKWFTADLENREYPYQNDSLTAAAEKTHKILLSQLPSLQSFPVVKIDSDDDGIVTISYYADKKLGPEARAKIEIDEKTGNLVVYSLNIQSKNGASIEVAREKALAFLQSLYGEQANQYILKRVVDNSQRLQYVNDVKIVEKITTVVFTSKTDPDHKIGIGVADTGEILDYEDDKYEDMEQNR